MQLIKGLVPSTARRALASLWGDLRGATLVQFVAILPVFVLLIFGATAVSNVMGAHATLCEAAHESARYLQVEAPRFPPDDEGYAYPDGWRRVAFGIAQTEIQSHKALRESVFDQSHITIWPSQKPVAPAGPDYDASRVTSSLFTVRVDAQIPNPLYLWFDGLGADSKLALTCQATGFFEDAPFRTTADDPAGEGCAREQGRPDCERRRRDRCTAGIPPTECHGSGCPTAECCPCRIP